jgi:hypothetical protein
MKTTISLLMLVLCVRIIPAYAAEYGVARIPAPVLNKPDFKAVFGGSSGMQLKVDRCGQVRELEYIALPGTVFKILKKQRIGAEEVFQVETDEYPVAVNRPLYVGSRFVALEQAPPESRKRMLPSAEKIVTALREATGSHYVWGGNIKSGVPELAKWFYSGIRSEEIKSLTLAGLDCSGLLYHATGGWTPRNSSQLIAYGKGVIIAGKQSAAIAAMLQPLDLIVWNGHVIIVLDRETVIESRLQCGKPGNGGVVVTPLQQRIDEIMRTRRPADSWPTGKKHQDHFVVRRWHVL